MKDWTKAILINYKKYIKYADKIDQKIEVLSSFESCFLTTEKQMEAICLLIEKKGRLINLRIIADRLKHALKSQWKILNDRFVEGDDLVLLAENYALSRGALNYRIEKAVEKAARLLVCWGFDIEYFKLWYEQEKNWLFAKLDSFLGESDGLSLGARVDDRVVDDCLALG